MSVVIVPQREPAQLIVTSRGPQGPSGADVATFTAGGSGAVERSVKSKLRDFVSIADFGAVADCTAPGSGTDNAAAINAAIAAAGISGAAVFIPKNALGYRVASPLVFTKGVKLIGQGFHENPGNVGGTAYTPPQNWRGSILVFDANVAGLKFVGYTDNNADSTAFEYESSSYSVVEDVALYGGGGTNTDAHGIESRVSVNLRNVRVENFAGDGVFVQATTAGALPWGNANSANLTRVIARGNKCHGFHITGTDANVITLINCDGSLNGGAGFLDNSLIGNNVYVGCHAATNNQSHGTATTARTKVVADWAGLSDANAGSFVTVHLGGQSNLYLSCYVEVGTGRKGEILEPSIVIGGILSETGSRTAAWTANAWNGSSGTGLTLEGVFGDPSLNLVNGNGSAVDVVNATGGTATMRVVPGSGTFSNLKLFGNGNSLALGLDLLVGGGAAYFSADSFQFRNAAQTDVAFTADANGLSLPTGNGYYIAGTKVLGSGAIATADATDLASVIALANAIKAKMNTA